MRLRSPLLVIGILILAAAVYLNRTHHTPIAGLHPAHHSVKLYYCKLDGTTLEPYRIRLGSAHDLQSKAFFAASHVIAGPPSAIRAIRFPRGTVVRAVHVHGSTIDVDLSNEISQSAVGGFSESGEFKALVWTLTDLPGISSIRVEVGGKTLPTLPGGHFELDEPLSRSDW